MKFDTFKSNYKKQIIVGSLVTIGLVSAITVSLSRAHYKTSETIKLVQGNVNYKTSDLKTVALYTETDSGYVEANDIPISGYALNTEKSMCKVQTSSSGIENAPKDNNVTIEYVDGKINFRGISKNNTRCYLYFDIIKDTTKPVITNVTTSVTKTEITVNVTATDDKGVTEYWYQLDSQAAVKGTGATHKFTGLTAGSAHTLKVYVKDAAGNQSDTTIKSVTTTPEGQTVDTIIAGITVKPGTPTFKNAATTDEGVYSVSDGMYGGTSYYWRGAVTNNYVKFAGKCWRIVRINGDKSIRLIYDGATCHANGTSTTDSLAATGQTYNASYNRSEYVGYTYTTGSQRTTSGTASNLKTQTDTWYNSNLASYADKIASGKFCNDRNVASGYTWSSQPSSTFYYAGWERSGAKSASTVTPTLSCPSGDVYTLKAGSITMDEVIMAGGKFGTPNSSYYLYNGNYYWTMSPYYCYGPNTSASVFRVPSDGRLDCSGVNGTNVSVRPVINLKAGTLFKAGGTGTQSNPYIVQ